MPASAEARDGAKLKATFTAFVDAAERWQGQHNYRNMWRWPHMEEPLEKLDMPVINEVLDLRNYRSSDASKTPFEQVQEGFYRVERYTPNLIAAMREACGQL